MRLRSLLNENDTAFAKFIADISYSSGLQGNIVLPSFIHQANNLAEFISRIYRDEDIQRPNLNSQVYFGERVILTSRNDTVDAINEIVLDKISDEKVTLLSTDSADINDADGLHTIPAEYLQSLNPSGLPPSQLELKVGVLVMLLRNIDPARGLCSGTRLLLRITDGIWAKSPPRTTGFPPNRYDSSRSSHMSCIFSGVFYGLIPVHI
ncbi:hypothetical protein RMATCC62417_11123 [Rhizopus microsporus]|nr:hypothetical protein RMATCC62417_11123 [Rhizopus microsporus]